MNRRGFFASLFAPLVARYLPKPKPAGETFFSFPTADMAKYCVGVDPAKGNGKTVVYAMKFRQVGMTSMAHKYYSYYRRQISYDWHRLTGGQ
jgi:hypothetical protein